MSTKSSFICGQTPNSQIVNLLNALNIKECVLDNVMTDAGWCCLHQDTNSVSQDADSCGQHQNTEYECADWINDCPGWLEVDDKCGTENT